MTAASHTEDNSLVIQSRMTEGAPGGRRTYATITCRSCGATDDAPLKDKNAGWARRIFKSRGWSVADRPGRHQCPTCAQGPRGLGGKSVREEQRDGRRAVFMSRKHPENGNRNHLMGGSSLRDGVLEIARVEVGKEANGPGVLQEIDPGLLEPDRMAEALSHLGHVTKHVEPPVVPDPSPPPPKRARKFEGPRQVEWKATGRPGSLPLSRKPADLPKFLTPPPPARQYKRKTTGYRYPGDAAVTARTFFEACGVDDPQVGRDFIVWAEGGEIGWAPAAKSLFARGAAYQQTVQSLRDLLAANPAPEPTPEPTPAPVEPVAPPEEPMSQPIPAATAAAAVRERRLAIIDKLNTVYLTDSGGRYTGMWSDAKVATELDVSSELVKSIRIENFGDGEGNESDNIALDKWRRDMTNRMAKATERQAKAIEELLAVNTDIEAIKAALSAGPK